MTGEKDATEITGRAGVDLALVHYPVYNKHREVVGSAVTNLDIHDIARACRTFGVDNFYVVTPFHDQQELVRKIIRHWQHGHGATANSDRRDALTTVSIWDDLIHLYSHLVGNWGERPFVMATCARSGRGCLSPSEIEDRLAREKRILLLFGTAWGMADEIIDGADALLPPVQGRGSYNHLSVRSAASIILDRLLGLRNA